MLSWGLQVKLQFIRSPSFWVRLSSCICLTLLFGHSVSSYKKSKKADGPDNIPGRDLRAFANELTDVLTSIVNLSLSHSTIPPQPSPLPKKYDQHTRHPAICLPAKQVDLRPQLFSTVPSPTCKTKTPTSGRSLWTTATAFNTVTPHKLTDKLPTLGLHPTLCDMFLYCAYDNKHFESWKKNKKKQTSCLVMLSWC